MRFSVRPSLLLAVGLGLVLGGIGWAVATGVAIPDQDPTPAMEAHAALHGRITDVMLLLGVTCVAVGSLWGLASFAQGRKRSPPAP